MGSRGLVKIQQEVIGQIWGKVALIHENCKSAKFANEN